MGKTKVLVKVQPEGKYSKFCLYPLTLGEGISLRGAFAGGPFMDKRP